MSVATFDQAAVLTAFFSSLFFLLSYSALAPWWTHAVGRSFALLDLGIAITIAPSALRYLVGLNLRTEVAAWYTGSSLFLVAVITLWRLTVILKIQQQATPRWRRSSPASPETPPESMGD